MLDRVTEPKKSAIIIFDECFEMAAREWVKETLQLKEDYQHFYMLPLPSHQLNTDTTQEYLKHLEEEHNITTKNTDSYLVIKKTKDKWESREKNSYYNSLTLNFAKAFKKHCVVITYDYYAGERKYSTLKLVRGHQRCSTSQGYPGGNVAQVPILRKIDQSSDWQSWLVEWFFFKTPKVNISPLYKYLTPSSLNEPDTNEKPDDLYEALIQQKISTRNEKVSSVLRRANHHYPNPKTISERLGNLFHAYASTLLNIHHHRELANKIANRLYAENDWSLQECLTFIKASVDKSDKPIDPEGTFQGVLLELRRIRSYSGLVEADYQLREYWEEKYDELDKLKEKTDGALKHCIASILRELKTLEKHEKPYAVLIRAAEATIDMVRYPTQESYEQQYQVASEMNQHAWGRVFFGLSLCLLGLAVGIAIGTAIYLTGGAAALIGAPLFVKGFTLTATFINAGAATLAGIAGASPLVAAASVCLFGKPVLQKKMEQLADIQLQPNAISLPAMSHRL